MFQEPSLPSVLRRGLPVLLLLTMASLPGCGGGEPKSRPPGGASASSGGSDLNSGPKAIETVSFNPGLAEWGAQVFEKRACVTCHAVGERKQGPDLHNVATRRTERWMRKQITDPEWMVKNDPLSRQMMAEYALQMANQQVPPQEVDALIQYFVGEAKESAADPSNR